MTDLPSGTVTFLFTDIEGSSKLAREHPYAWVNTQAREQFSRALSAFEAMGASPDLARTREKLAMA
jgi:class 3 adenylate cyclase